MEKLVVILPWPDKRLSPNARVHPMALYRAKMKAKEDAGLCTLAALAGFREKSIFNGTGRLLVSILAVPKTNRHRDEDNLQASLKAALDGIAAALSVNDSRFRIQGTEIHLACPSRPHIEITIQPEEVK